MQEKKIHHLIVGDLAANCWIYPLDNLSDNGQPAGFTPCAVIDPGEEGGRIIAFLDQHKLFPSYIILTHGHFDHIGAVSALAKEYRRRAPSSCVTIAIHAADAEYLGPDSHSVHRRSLKSVFGDSAYIAALPEPPPDPDKILQEGDTLGPFTVLHLPGHTPGSIALWDEKAGVMFTGDTLFCGGYGRTDLPGGSGKQLYASLTRLFAMNGDIQVYPGHDGITTIGQEARDFQT
ncbi:MAG: MBL fold metallo-hydrolase [Treponema sp.]|jgi:glyoxylase-like metal-dependent hydrolase (beta-lactamase superfamily II)|nr:MBL fold metallo-hydrolase [Treponema sp.]